MESPDGHPIAVFPAAAPREDAIGALATPGVKIVLGGVPKGTSLKHSPPLRAQR